MMIHLPSVVCQADTDEIVRESEFRFLEMGSACHAGNGLSFSIESPLGRHEGVGALCGFFFTCWVP